MLTALHTPRDAEVCSPSRPAARSTAKARSWRSRARRPGLPVPRARHDDPPPRSKRPSSATRAAGQGPGLGLTCPRALLMRRRALLCGCSHPANDVAGSGKAVCEFAWVLGEVAGDVAERELPQD